MGRSKECEQENRAHRQLSVISDGEHDCGGASEKSADPSLTHVGQSSVEIGLMNRTEGNCRATRPSPSSRRRQLARSSALPSVGGEKEKTER